MTIKSKLRQTPDIRTLNGSDIEEEVDDTDRASITGLSPRRNRLKIIEKKAESLSLSIPNPNKNVLPQSNRSDTL